MRFRPDERCDNKTPGQPTAAASHSCCCCCCCFFSSSLSSNPSSALLCVCLSQRHGRPPAPVTQPRASLVMVGRTMLTSRSLCNSIKLPGMEEGNWAGGGGLLFIASTQRRRVILSLHIWPHEGVRTCSESALTFCRARPHVYV